LLNNEQEPGIAPDGFLGPSVSMRNQCELVTG
jgi:hypothetical protein